MNSIFVHIVNNYIMYLSRFASACLEILAIISVSTCKSHYK